MKTQPIAAAAAYAADISSLTKRLPYFEVRGRNEKITSLACAAADVLPGGLFFCLNGTRADGHAFAAKAAGAGAAALVVERFLPLKTTQILVKDARSAMAFMAGDFYGNPIGKMKLIGVTGTNGKTTTTYILREIAETAGVKTGLIGTTCNKIGDTELPARMTTPDPIELHALFADMLSRGVRWAVMEVSAHAIDLRKMDGARADIAVLTNVSQDHLDYFETLERYKEVKKSYFAPDRCKHAVVNADDPAGREIIEAARTPVTTYGCENPSDVFAVNFETNAKGLKYVVNLFDDIYDVRFRLPGRYNMYNTLAAAAAARALGASVKDIAAGIGALRSVPGRFNVLDTRPYTVIVDFAHTPEGIANVCKCAREITRGRLTVVFGCGGDRDKAKRPLMGRAAGGAADFVILTSDNPRFEPPFDIMRQAEAGLREAACRYVAIENRREAIAYALKTARKNDTVLILGKGDENYQEICGVKYPFGDADAVYEILGLKEEKAN
ncbi:MAG: UDP-N-acetylmuramoyl-L-alanyl-D-glutamate--2,6-diaminopimelate ligase [Clostridiales bacterium]|jgi:UDP-N-acetylmuramoyl-L-alanyl-D-glutamate--2,6-diaminopimelate ligase|nr:UDP-N-acetylmuramoyl-L-alanyl-D-glutamate--2,6-diaminopimelate ligase [Clostridiales bacterium]